MALIADNTFRGQRVELDGNEFQRNVFLGCTLVYKGGTLPVFTHNEFRGCRWLFEGPAERTLQFMKGVAMMMGRDDGKSFIENTFPELLQQAEAPVPP